MDRDRLERGARRGLEEVQERRERHKAAITVLGWLRKAAQGIYDRVVPPAQRLLDSIAGNPGLVAAFAVVAATAGLATVAAVQADRAATAAADHAHDDPTGEQARTELRASIGALSAEIVTLVERIDRLEQTPAPVLEVTAADLVGVDDRVNAASAEIDRIAVELADLAQASTVTTGPSPATTVDLAPDIAALAERVETVAAEVAAVAALVDQLATTTTATTAAPGPVTSTTTTTEPATTTAPPPAPVDPGGACDPTDPACCDPADPACI